MSAQSIEKLQQEERLREDAETDRVQDRERVKGKVVEEVGMYRGESVRSCEARRKNLKLSLQLSTKASKSDKFKLFESSRTTKRKIRKIDILLGGVTFRHRVQESQSRDIMRRCSRRKEKDQSLHSCMGLVRFLLSLACFQLSPDACVDSAFLLASWASSLLFH